MDLNTTAYRIVRTLTEEKAEDSEKRNTKRMAGKAGGAARSSALTAARRSEIAVAASRARWAKRHG